MNYIGYCVFYPDGSFEDVKTLAEAEELVQVFQTLAYGGNCTIIPIVPSEVK